MRYTFAVLFGLVMGSFGNVCIYRLPEKKSIIRPGSHCPKCKSKIAWYDNIPLLSFIFLGARCRNCKEKISFVYPAVELAVALFAVACLYRFGWNLASLLNFIFCWALVVIIFIDLRHRIIPNVITFPGVVIGLIGSATVLEHSFLDGLLGAFLGGFLFWFVGQIYFWVTKRVGLGGGDIKLMAVVGAFLGFQNMVLTLGLSSIMGALFGVYLIIIKRKSSQYALPFGPFIAAGAMIALFFGWEIIEMYQGLLQ
ncbi:prepilin peptidase [Bdellovibrionota bacterium]